MSNATIASEVWSKTARQRVYDAVGKTFDFLTIIAFTEYKGSSPCFLCKCVCGKQLIVREDKLITRETVSCGCLKGAIGLIAKRNNALAKGKFLGIYQQKNRYKAMFHGNYLGLFETAIEAAKAYDEASYKYYKEPLILNFPEDYSDE